jgi:hypothetical protein
LELQRLTHMAAEGRRRLRDLGGAPAPVGAGDGLPEVEAGKIHAPARRSGARGCLRSYVNAGAWERFRRDKDKFPDSVLGRALDGWPGERWLDIRRIGVLSPIMKARIARCARKGFDAVEPDNIDGYQNKSGFSLSGTDQLRYNRWFARQAHKKGLSVALKNDLGQVKALVPNFDFAIVEECFQYRECGKAVPFIDAGKAVLEVEYKLERSDFCAKAQALGFSSMKKRLSLGPWRRTCS